MDDVGEPSADRKHAAHRFGFDEVESRIYTGPRWIELEATQKMIERPRASPGTACFRFEDERIGDRT